MTKSKSKKVPKPDAGDLLGEPVEIEKPVKEKKVKTPKIEVSEEAFMKALNANEGKASLNTLLNSFDKTGYEQVSTVKLRKAIFEKAQELVKDQKIGVTRPKPKSRWVFVTQ